MSAPAAARYDDIVKHTSKMLGFVAGALTGMALVALGVVTCGIGTAAVIGAVAGLGGAAIWDAVVESPGIKTGTIKDGSTTISINRRAAVSVLDTCFCYIPVIYNHGVKSVVEGSGTVFFHCRPASRQGDALLCDAKISTGSPNVFIGGPAVRVKGTKRSWVDTVLDYTSMSITLASLVSPWGWAALAVSEAGSYGLHKMGATTTQNAAAQNTLGLLDEGAVVLGDVRAENIAIKATNATAEQLAIEATAKQTAAVQDAAYAAYVARTGTQARPRPYWLSRHFVQNMLTKKTPPPIKPNILPFKSFNWKEFAKKAGPGIAVEVVRVGREVWREMQIPDEMHVHCGDTSWLEPV